MCMSLTRSKLTPTELENIYANAQVQTKSNTADVDYERGRDAVRGLLARAVAEDASDIHIVRAQTNSKGEFSNRWPHRAARGME